MTRVVLADPPAYIKSWGFPSNCKQTRELAITTRRRRVTTATSTQSTQKMDKPLEYHTKTLESVAQCLEKNQRDWMKRVPIQKRKDLLSFIDDPTAEVDENFMGIFDRIVGSLGAKINLKLFELVLKIGVNFATPEDDAYWFALFNCNDYGPVFDLPEVCELLLDEVFLANRNSWKAACLSCILIQDYPSAKGIVSRILSKNCGRVLKLFQKVNDYITCCYMTELLSQLEAPALISQIFPKHLKVKKDMFANDTDCVKFIDQFDQDPNIYRFKSFAIEGTVRCGPSVCQLFPFYFVVLVNHDEYAAPIQFEFTEVNSVQNNEKKVRFHLGQQPSKTLLSVDIPPLAVVDLEFSTADIANAVMKGLDQVTKHTVMSTPRKISVVQDFIKVTSKIYEEADESSSLSDAILTPSSPIPANQAATTCHEFPINATNPEISEDSFIPEENSMFGSPAINNTTKNTSTSNHGRAISIAIAEASKKHKESTSAAQVTSINPANLVLSRSPATTHPGNAEVALNQLDKEDILRANTVSPIKSNQRPIRQPISNAHTKKQGKVPIAISDIWDFDDSDPDKTVAEASAAKSKAMKFLNQAISKAKYQNTVAPPKKNAIQKRLEDADNISAVVTKDIILPSNESHLLMSDSLSGLTSPLTSRNGRVSAKASMKRPDPNQVDTHDDGYSSDHPSPKRRKLRSNTVEDNSYKPSQIINAPPQTSNPKEKGNSKPVTNALHPVATRVTRSRKAAIDQVDENTKDPEPQATGGQRESLSQIFKKNPKAGALKKPVQAKTATMNVKKTVKPVEISNKANSRKSNVQSDKNSTNPPLVEQQAQQQKQTIPPPVQEVPETHDDILSSLPMVSDLTNANMLLSEAYTNTLQKQIYDSITAFSNQLVKKIHIINDEINKKVMTDLTTKYETLFNDLRGSFQKDVDEMCGFIGDVKGLLNLPEHQLVEYIKQKKFGQIGAEDHGA